jgi:hypothetical protein
MGEKWQLCLSLQVIPLEHIISWWLQALLWGASRSYLFSMNFFGCIGMTNNGLQQVGHVHWHILTFHLVSQPHFGLSVTLILIQGDRIWTYGPLYPWKERFFFFFGTHSQKWELRVLRSSGIPKNSELDCRGWNTSHWGVLNINEKFLKHRCPKWPRVSHLNICSPSYGQKKGRESNWQFDSQPQKVGNQPDSNVQWGSATRCWKVLEESYKIGSDLVPIGGRGEKLWWPKVLGVQTGTVLGLHLGSPGTKRPLGRGRGEAMQWILYGEGGGFPWVRAVVSQVSPRSPVACPNTKRVQNEF